MVERSTRGSSRGSSLINPRMDHSNSMDQVKLSHKTYGERRRELWEERGRIMEKVCQGRVGERGAGDVWMNDLE